VTATGLFEVADFSQISDYPVSHVFPWPAPPLPTLKWFTDIALRQIQFEDVAADATYYDVVGDHSAPPAPGALIPILDREVMYDDGTILPAGDGMSVARAFAVDVTQGFYFPARNPAVVLDAVALTASELVLYGLPFGFKVTVSMSQVQKDEFSWTGRGIFSLTEYDKVGLVPPTWTSDPYWIDAEDTSAFAHGWDSGALTWTIVVGASSVPASWPVGAPGVRDVAVRYFPTVRTGDCTYCKSYFIRITVGTTTEGEAHYGADRSTGTPLRRAQERLQSRIENFILPSHVRVMEWVDV